MGEITDVKEGQKWSPKYKKWICNWGCAARPIHAKTDPCPKCEGYRTKKEPVPGAKRGPKVNHNLAFKGRWVPRGGIMVPVWPDGRDRNDDDKH